MVLLNDSNSLDLSTESFTVRTLELTVSLEDVALEEDEVYELLEAYEQEHKGELERVISAALADKLGDVQLDAEASSMYRFEQEYSEVSMIGFALQESKKEDHPIYELISQTRDELIFGSRLIAEVDALFVFSFSVYDSIDKEEMSMGSGKARCVVNLEVFLENHFEFDADSKALELDWVDVTIEYVPNVDLGQIGPDWTNEDISD